MNEIFRESLREGEKSCVTFVYHGEIVYNLSRDEKKLQRILSFSVNIKSELWICLPPKIAFVCDTKERETKAVMRSGLLRTLWFINANESKERKKKCYVISIS